VKFQFIVQIDATNRSRRVVCSSYSLGDARSSIPELSGHQLRSCKVQIFEKAVALPR
jgi:hypothetical protein